MLFLNPGFIEKRRAQNERAAQVGGLSSGVALAELGRRGLVPRSKSAQDLHCGAGAVAREVDLRGAVFDLAVVGGVLYCARADNAIAMFDTASWQQVGVLAGHEGWVNAMYVDDQRKLLYSASEDTTVKVWDLRTRECVQTLEGHEMGAVSLAVSASSLYVGCTGRVMVWDTESWRLVDRLSNHTQVLRVNPKP